MKSFVLATLVLALGCGCSSVPTLTFADGGTETDQEATEPETCPSNAAACCGTRACYGDDCKCDECIAKCGDDQICCTKKAGPPVNRLTCKPRGQRC